MVRSCVPAVWGLGQLDIFSLDVKRIILMKIKEAFKQEMKDKESLSFNGSSLYAIKLRSKRIDCCYRYGRFTCNTVRRENGCLARAYNYRHQNKNDESYFVRNR